MQARTRFAPSPTGLLHVGNACSALLCRNWAEENQAELLLRIEDIDFTRCRAEFVDNIYEDLSWLGLKWKKPVRRQSEHFNDYRKAIHRLRELGVIYPCFCTRKSIQLEMESMGLAPHAEDTALLYPGICRNIKAEEQERRMEQDPFAWRLDVTKAISIIELPLLMLDDDGNSRKVEIDHDVVIGRKDISFSYHLSVVVDDAIQGITHIIRGKDLEPSTGIHCLLQKLLDLPAPIYHHHALLHTPNGERLAKRHRSTTLRSLRVMGIKPEKLAQLLIDNSDMVWPFGPDDHDAIIRQLA